MLTTAQEHAEAYERLGRDPLTGVFDVAEVKYALRAFDVRLSLVRVHIHVTLSASDTTVRTSYLPLWLLWARYGTSAALCSARLTLAR